MRPISRRNAVQPQPTNRLTRLLDRIGKPMVQPAQVAGELWALLRLTIYYTFRGKRRPGQVVEQMHIIGNKSLVFITVTLGFLGMISIYQVAIQIQRVLPDFSMIGAAFLKMVVRELGPTITGLMVATRTGSAIAAEIGSMVVTEQVDALRMSNADPVDYLVVPRFLACGSMLIALTAYAVLIATVTGMLMGYLGFGISTGTFLNMSLVGWRDITVGCTKALAYGFTIPIMASHAGLGATGGSEGVGWATTRAVVNSSFAVIILDVLISGLAYVVLAE